MLIKLNEDSRNKLLSKAKQGANYKTDQSKGRNRYERRTKSKISNSVKEYNRLNMNKFFKEDILDLNILVHGETDDYLVGISFSGILELIREETEKNQDIQVDLRLILQMLKRAFNREDHVLVKCQCLHPDTKIKLLDGTCPTISEMCDRYNSGEQMYVYSVDEKGDFKPGIVERVWKTGESSSFIKVTLDNGEYILTTPEHLYMMRTGEFRQAKDLSVGDSLMSMYFNSMNYKSIDDAVSSLMLNHKIVSIERVETESTPVYDIKVKDFQNFVVNAGVVLHNCPDWKYRMAYFASVNDIILGEKETIKSDKTNPDDKLGPACKHVILVLSNNSWIVKLASAINNYINYIKDHYEKNYAEIIFPQLYGMPYDDYVQLGLFDKDELDNTMDKDKDELDKLDTTAANEYGRTRTQFKKGNQSGIQFARNPEITDDDQLELDLR